MDSGKNNLLDLQRTCNPGTQYCDSHHEWIFIMHDLLFVSILFYFPFF